MRRRPVTPPVRAAHITDMNTPNPVILNLSPELSAEAATALKTTGGTVHHLPENNFQLRVVPEVIHADFENITGKELIRAAEHLPRVSAKRSRRAANLLAHPLRASYKDFWTNPEDAEDRTEAFAIFRRRLPALAPMTTEYYLALVAYAVHTEMKFRADPAYILDPDHDFELLIDQADFDTEEDLLGAGLEENLERLETLADTAAAYALWANENAAFDARQAAQAA